MAFEKALEHLKTFGFEDRAMTFDESSATVKEAAAAIGCNEAEIAKTLSFWVESKPVLIVASGDQKIDNSKFKAQFHTKAQMISREDVEPAIGHAVGGVCPFGVNAEVVVYLDESLKKFEIVYPACGSSNSAVKLTIAELEKATNGAEWIDVCKTIEPVV